MLADDTKDVDLQRLISPEGMRYSWSAIRLCSFVGPYFSAAQTAVLLGSATLVLICRWSRPQLIS